jgi:alkylation response protein AidB-like acyl-CoA dehydrogenase
MRFGLTPEQEELSRTVSDWSTRHFGGSALRSGIAAGADAEEDSARWHDMARFGWLGIMVAEEDGGAGGEILDACLVAEQLQRHLAPVPYCGNAIVAASALKTMPDEIRRESLQSLSCGEARYSLILDHDLDLPASSEANLAWEWSEGSRLVLLDGESVRWTEDAAVRVTTQDFLRDVARVGGLPQHAPVAGLIENVNAAADLALSAVLLGAMQGAMDMALSHVRNREQFGQPIGFFQAVQHMCADMYVEVETTRTMVYGAAWKLAHADRREGLRAAAAAKAWAAERGRRVCETALQLHGGMGFTWESDIHLYLRSAIFCADAFGGLPRALRSLRQADASHVSH